MASRRQAKLASIIRHAVSDVLLRGLADPRVEGVISVTEVKVTPDMRTADVFISIISAGDATGKTCFAGIEHASRYIQAQVAGSVNLRFCPMLRFHLDDKMKKVMETMRLIDEANKPAI
ncbi:MAG TPA: 30S ribosome-binding factor RbfA [Sedimentisphaerales bacterium]|nr:30S ribosome-binding factor RbfA [Sedimentisphaerales bacterium]